MTEVEINDWVDAYIQIQSSENDQSYRHPLWWAVEKAMLPNDETDPEDVWVFILNVLRKNPSDRVFSILAAGPLEDLIQSHGPQFIERIEHEAASNPLFRELLGGVWESSSAEIWKRIELVRGNPW